MFGRFKNKEAENKDLIILKKTEPNVCGGTDATLDPAAPKEITSEEMTFFSASCSFKTVAFSMEKRKEAPMRHLFAFAALTEKGSFLTFEKLNFDERRDEGFQWALVKENVFPELVKLARRYDLAAKNGYHSQTHGLPENFGGSVKILFAGGEKISYSDNQSPILSIEAGEAIASLFERAMQGEKEFFPDLSLLSEIRFEETGLRGGFNHARLILQDDGTGVLKQEERFEDPKVYESEKTLGAEKVTALKEKIEKFALPLWGLLPESGFKRITDKKMTFVFRGGDSFTADEGRLLPDPLARGFFNVELDLIS